MDRSTPTAARLIVSDDPPALMKGSVIPVVRDQGHHDADVDDRLAVIQVVMPAASRPPNVSGAASATRNPS